MSGEKIDMDEIRDAASFDSAQIVIEDDAEEKSEQEQPQEIGEEDFDEVVAQPSQKSSSSKIIKNDDGPVINSDTRSVQRESSTREIVDALKETIKSERKSELFSSRREASARSNAQSSMRKSSRRPSSGKSSESSVKPKRQKLPEINSRTKPRTPEDSYKEEYERKKRGHTRTEGDEDEESEEDIDMMPKTPAEKHLYWKTRLQILKTRFKDVTIPKDEAELTWQELRKIYYIEMDRVSITKNVDAYRLIMIVGCFVIEYIGYKILKVDITGFGVHSMKSMWRYERLLIELGEKDYASFGENWPVEFRLIGLMLVSAVIFVIAKSLFKATGQDMSDDFFKFFQDLGNHNFEGDVGPASNGMDAPNPNDNGQGGGLMGMISGLMGGGQGGGIMDIVGNLMKGMNQGGVQAAEKTETEDLDEDDEERNRINPPRLRRKSRSARARAKAEEE